MKITLSLCVVLLFQTTATSAVDFETQILPIFEARCIKCHGAEKAQAKLSLHSADGIKAKLASDDHLIVAGKAEESQLYKRLTLPADDKKRMPKGGDPLDKEQLDLIAKWISEGASFAAAAKAPAEAAPSEPVAEEKPKLEPLPLPEVPAPSQEAIEKLRAAGAQVMPLFAESHLLDISFALSPHPPTDESLQLLQDVAQQVISLNLKNAKASDDGWAVIGQLENLTSLNVLQSSFSDAAAKNLAGLARLESLNLYGTQVTDAALEPLKGLERLRKLYLWQTKVTYEAASALEKEMPGIEWNLGWDHPVVERKRLEEQKVEFAELVKKAEADTARLKGELQIAEEAKGTAAERLKEVEERLSQVSDKQSTETTTDGSPSP